MSRILLCIPSEKRGQHGRPEDCSCHPLPQPEYVGQGEEDCDILGEGEEAEQERGDTEQHKPRHKHGAHSKSENQEN